MSAEDADRLLKDLRTNSALKEKLKSAGAGGFEKTAGEAGYHVTRNEFADAIKAVVVKQDLAGPKGFQVADGIVSGVTGGVSSHVSGAVSGVV
jgi:predicted ribosomally synthesized peptide with nif11-like leader